MDDVTLSVNHDVPVVPIFDLKDVASYRVTGHGLYEIESSALELDAIFPSIFRLKESKQVIDLRPTHFISRSGIWDDIDDSTLRVVLVL